MMSKYTYIVEEWSTDTRKYRVESDEKLTKEEVKDSVREVGIPIKSGEEIKIDELPSGKEVDIIGIYEGVEYGEDSQMDIVEGDTADD
jgi:predicted Zn-dependent protease with MMP-like domain